MFGLGSGVRTRGITTSSTILALLVRPDGIVGWRCRERPKGLGPSKDPRRLLGLAYLRIIGRR